MIAVVDSGVANLASVLAALQRLGVAADVTHEAAKIRQASHVILPGVGAAGAAMAQLTAKNLIAPLRALTQPVLGLCLGMQLLFSQSEEGQTPGLDLVPGEVKQLTASPDLPVPHMGWNQLTLRQPEQPLLRGLTDGDFVYFVHSFAVPVGAATIASCAYGGEFSAIVAHRNFHGCQFHPERSSAVGGKILQNFLAL